MSVAIRKICLIGATGFIGQHIVARLSHHPEQQITLVSRQPRPRHQALSVLPGVQWVYSPKLDRASLAQIFNEHDAVISMAGILHGSTRQFQQVHAELVQSIVAACLQAGVRRLVHISALGADPQSASHYQQSKAQGEAAITQSLLDWSILRPSVVFGYGDNFLNLFAKLNRQLPLIPLAGAHTLFQPVWVEDLAHAVCACLDTRASIHQALELAGPRRYSLQQLVAYSGQLCGHPRPIIPIPLPLGMLQAALLACLPGPPLMSIDNLRSLKRNNISDQNTAWALLGFEPTALEAVAPDWLQH